MNKLKFSAILILAITIDCVHAQPKRAGNITSQLLRKALIGRWEHRDSEIRRRFFFKSSGDFVVQSTLLGIEKQGGFNLTQTEAKYKIDGKILEIHLVKMYEILKEGGKKLYQPDEHSLYNPKRYYPSFKIKVLRISSKELVISDSGNNGISVFRRMKGN